MPPRLPDDKRQAIADAIRAGGKRNEIAREHGVAQSTVSQIANEQNIPQPFDRTQTARASAAKRVDNAARRADEAQALLDELAAARARFRAPADQVVPSGQIVTLDLPPARDLRDLATAYQAMAKTHMELDRHDAATGHDDAKSMLIGLSEGLRAYQRAQDSS